MRGDIVYRVYGVHEGRENDYFFGAYRTVSEAEARIESLHAKDMDGKNWAKQYYGGDLSRPGAGFCPVGFYVPDWWDVHDGYIIPGSESWNRDREWPVGSFGFVWGCYWGDDSSFS